MAFEFECQEENETTVIDDGPNNNNLANNNADADADAPDDVLSNPAEDNAKHSDDGPEPWEQWNGPSENGLYNPELEKDACGVGFIVSIEGTPSHKVSDKKCFIYNCVCILKHFEANFRYIHS